MCAHVDVLAWTRSASWIVEFAGLRDERPGRSQAEPEEQQEEQEQVQHQDAEGEGEEHAE
eukprot:1995257-Alexandrium_andersonii.AAC.1